MLATVSLSAACAQEAGRSDYWDSLSPASPGIASLPGPGTPVTLAELRASADVAPTTPLVGQNNDDLLVASLSSAIERAGRGETLTPVRVTEVPPLANELPPIQNNGLTEAEPVVEIEGSNVISDNSFDRVVQEQTIETDRERLARLSGDRVYPRSGLLRNRSSAQCRKYRNPDEAQRAFLSEGGPNDDPLKIDPDGDGFVCGWSPAPFRRLNAPANG